MKTLVEFDNVTYETTDTEKQCKFCAFYENSDNCRASQNVVCCSNPYVVWVKSTNQAIQQSTKKEPIMPNLSKVNLNQGEDFTIKSPYIQAYIIMQKDTEDKSYQFKGPRIYVDVMKAKERCDAMNRYNKGKPHIVVGFDLVNGGELKYV